jgi:hypothetical protein
VTESKQKIAVTLHPEPKNSGAGGQRPRQSDRRVGTDVAEDEEAEVGQVPGMRNSWIALTELHYQALGVQTSRTFERAFVVARFDRLNPLDPHHATALGARRVFQIIDGQFH